MAFITVYGPGLPLLLTCISFTDLSMLTFIFYKESLLSTQHIMIDSLFYIYNDLSYIRLLKCTHELQLNYGGIQAKWPMGLPVEDMEDNSQMNVVSSWNIAEYLPKVTKVCHFPIKISTSHENNSFDFINLTSICSF